MNDIKTGDMLLCCNNMSTGFLLRFATASEYCHVGIAVRLIKVNNKYKVSISSEGELYILEISTGTRNDILSGEKVTGAAISNMEWVLSRYNMIAVRKLHDKYRTEEMAQRTLEFIEKYRGYTFTSSISAFVKVWSGLSIIPDSNAPNEIFCTELNILYYLEVVEPGKGIVELMGPGAPSEKNMYTPGHFTLAGTPNAIIFNGKEEIVYRDHGDTGVVLLLPFLIGVGGMVFLGMLLSENKNFS